MFRKLRVLASSALLASVPLYLAAQAEPEKATSPGTLTSGTTATESDVWFDRYQFRNGATLPRLRIHYATLGQPHRNERGDIDNAILLLHWTVSGGEALLTPNYIRSLFAPGRPLDARRYYLIFPDNIGHGKSSKPSDGLKASFPNYGYGDLVDLQHKLVTETLGIKHLHAILGMSMGGMNAWQWAETYPDAMDGVMPVVSLPIKVSGRNLLWRRMVIDTIRSNADGSNGNNAHSPDAWLASAIIRMMIDGVPHLQAAIPDITAADAFIASAHKQAQSADAIDLLYSLQSSADYDPEPSLPSIKTKVVALNFSDDEFNPQELHVLERLMPKVPQGQFTIQAGTEASWGHLTMAHPELWADHVGKFMQILGGEPTTSTVK